tara:strand:- start:179 stop:463 length:285 start_codon:yes stop_codon:yes gene_type:complete
MPKTEKVKTVVPIKELESTKFTDVIELERIVTPDPEKRVDHIFVKRKKICRANPAEIFSTEEYARFDIAWPEEIKKDIKQEINEEQNQNLQVNN